MVINHPIQNQILVNLLYKKESKFSELNKFNIENSEFTYHLNQLIKYSLVIKNSNSGKYSLTDEGLLIASRIDFDKINAADIPKIGVCIFVEKDESILLSKKLREPNKNRFILPGRKVVQGKSLKETAEICLESVGLRGELSYLGVFSFRSDLAKNGMDRIMHVFKGNSIEGDVKTTKDASFEFINIKDIKNLKTKVQFLDEQILSIKTLNKVLYKEINLDI